MTSHPKIKTNPPPTNWRNVKLGAISTISSGKSIHKSEYVADGQYPIFGANGEIGRTDNYLLDEKVIFTGRVGTLGSIFMSNDKAWFSDNTLIIKVKNEHINYVYFYLKNTSLQHLNVGSTQPLITQKGLGSIEFTLPPLPEQKAIAGVLGAFDDKIELLRKQNKTLEHIGQTLFQEWFVENADPNWEKVKLGDSPLSKIMSSGIDEFEGKKVYLATADVQGVDIQNTNTQITYQNRPSRANMQPVEYSVWFAKKGEIRKTIMFDNFSTKNKNTFILSTGFSGLKTTPQSHYYIWCFILSDYFQKKKDSLVGGSVQPDISNAGINKILINSPNSKTLEKFNEYVQPLFHKTLLNTQQIQTLEKMRDTLLPKLMSGEVRVEG